MRRIRCENCNVRNHSVICDLPPDAVNDFTSVGITSVYRPNQVLFSEGNPCLGLYIVCNGNAKLFYSDRFGRDYILGVVGPGSVLGELDLADEAILSVSAEALTELQLCFLPTQRLVTFLRKHPMTAVRFIGALSRELAAARRKVRELAFKDAESRMAGLLAGLAEVDDGNETKDLDLKYTRRELAEMIGVSTETAIRMLSKLRSKGVISTERRKIQIKDPERLHKLACHDELAT